jgi:predicted RNA methylase
VIATTTGQMGSFYNEKLTASQLRKYRQSGPIPSTQALIDALIAEGVKDATVLDIGGGIGAIQHELLAAGAAYVTSVDASAPYLEAAVFAMNLVLRLRRKPVRAAIRPPDTIERIARENGLSPHFSRNVGPAWQVALYRRP